MSEEGNKGQKPRDDAAAPAQDDRLAAAMEAAMEAVERVQAGAKERQDGEPASEGEAPPAEAAAAPAAAAPVAAPAEPAEAAPDPAERIAALEKQVEDWKGRALRTAADLENIRKRFAREREDLRKFGIESLLKDLLPVADNMERAVGHIGEDQEGPLAEGFRMILQQFATLLERHGARPFDAMGQPFDPQVHEAMSQLDREGVEPGTVIEVFQRGWMLHDRLARPAMVIVARAPAGQES